MPGPEVKTHRGYGPQPLWQRLLVGWGGSAHSQKCLVPKTGDYAFPAHLLAHRFFPSFLNAGARARARVREHQHSHTGIHACAKHSSRAPPSCPSPSVGQTPRSLNRKRAEPRGKKMPPTLKIFYPLIFSITHWEVSSGRSESLPISEVPATASAKPATGP